ncbi:SphA family protein [Pseudoxanthomonas kalamensis]|uniref:SphA family protein n=1 Tax=Pseudoxanthomonas kalamensis TaxID=289483 RepID=UPI001391E961|nr:transporter [Pseudoxanthomonas kalamensis]
MNLRSALLATGLVMAGLGFMTDVQATEGALGRPITAMQIQPFTGLIPPDPGMQWSLGYVHYSGEIGAGREVPLAGQIAFGLEADVDLFSATGVYIWPTRGQKWNFASMVTLPYIGNDVTASVSALGGTRSVQQSASGQFDLFFAPVIASYHVDPMTHWSFAAYVYAPTANYSTDRLANEGLNVWTVSPTVGFTKLYLQGGLELSASAAVDWYSDNDDTGYGNGMVGRLEGLAILRTPSGWGGGLAAGYIQQIEDDEGALADALNGFKGSSLGVGPIVTFSKTWEDGDSVSLSLRYVKEFSVKNRFEGSPLMISAGVNF